MVAPMPSTTNRLGRAQQINVLDEAKRANHEEKLAETGDPDLFIFSSDKTKPGTRDNFFELLVC